MNPYKVTRSKVREGDSFVTRRVDVEVMNTASNSRRVIIVRPLASSNTAQAEGKNAMGDEELRKRAESFVRTRLQNEEFVRKMEERDPYTVDMPSDFHE